MEVEAERQRDTSSHTDVPRVPRVWTGCGEGPRMRPLYGRPHGHRERTHLVLGADRRDGILHGTSLCWYAPHGGESSVPYVCGCAVGFTETLSGRGIVKPVVSSRSGPCLPCQDS